MASWRARRPIQSSVQPHIKRRPIPPPCFGIPFTLVRLNWDSPELRTASCPQIFFLATPTFKSLHPTPLAFMSPKSKSNPHASSVPDSTSDSEEESQSTESPKSTFELMKDKYLRKNERHLRKSFEDLRKGTNALNEAADPERVRQLHEAQLTNLRQATDALELQNKKKPTPRSLDKQIGQNTKSVKQLRNEIQIDSKKPKPQVVQASSHVPSHNQPSSSGGPAGYPGVGQHILGSAELREAFPSMESARDPSLYQDSYRGPSFSSSRPSDVTRSSHTFGNANAPRHSMASAHHHPGPSYSSTFDMSSVQATLPQIQQHPAQSPPMSAVPYFAPSQMVPGPGGAPPQVPYPYSSSSSHGQSTHRGRGRGHSQASQSNPGYMPQFAQPTAQGLYPAPPGLPPAQCQNTVPPPNSGYRQVQAPNLNPNLNYIPSYYYYCTANGCWYMHVSNAQ
ncbi:hypothetical protein R3P38DRAFT_3030292 [Favolaschia claudopus]|uniref:Uncharacterized protein n=1 Tax=Favolaschia claudopus TaxID=2862362 RepID=A0AAW0AEP3_9AGAR